MKIGERTPNRIRRYLPARLQRGQSLVEFALVLPVLVLLLVMAADFGRIYYSYIQINNAAREGAAFGAASPTDHAGIESRALQETNTQQQSGESPIVVTETCADSAGTPISCADATDGDGPGNTITVTVYEGFSALTPLVNNFFDNNLVMTASATATVLGYAAPGSGGAPPPICPPPIASFTVVVTSGLSILVDPSASTPNSGDCNISGYNWTWGNGSDDVGSATGDHYTYADAGTYTITLEATNQGGAATTTRDVTVPAGPPPPPCTAPTAAFTFTRSGSGNKTYHFTDMSTVDDEVSCPVTDWLWQFDDGAQSNAQNPTHQYQTGGTHRATLTVWNQGGSDSVGPQ